MRCRASNPTFFFELLAEYECDAMLVGGDVSNGLGSLNYLTKIQKAVQKPLYFVLGNHDYYYGSIDNIRKEASKLSQEHPDLCYLSAAKVIPLSEKTALIGHDGWSDGRAGNYAKSDVLLNDYFLIAEIKNLNAKDRLVKLNELGAEAAHFLSVHLKEALKHFESVVLLTHVPPFEECCISMGVSADPNWTPHFVGQLTGKHLEEIMRKHPNKKLLILCGHSHWGNDIQILPNLRVVTGHSDLGNPYVQGQVFIN